jgi:hypothetical protein
MDKKQRDATLSALVNLFAHGVSDSAVPDYLPQLSKADFVELIRELLSIIKLQGIEKEKEK